MYYIEIPKIKKIPYMELVGYMFSRIVDIFEDPVVEITSMAISSVLANTYTHHNFSQLVDLLCLKIQ